MEGCNLLTVELVMVICSFKTSSLDCTFHAAMNHFSSSLFKRFVKLLQSAQSVAAIIKGAVGDWQLVVWECTCIQSTPKEGAPVNVALPFCWLVTH